MIYRKLDEDGDYTFGQGPGNFYVDVPEAVAQAVETRLGLIEGEWFLNVNQGTPYNSKILGAGKISSYNYAIQDVIRNTQGVVRIEAYSSDVDPNTRAASVEVTIDTVYGQATINTTL